MASVMNLAWHSGSTPKLRFSEQKPAPLNVYTKQSLNLVNFLKLHFCPISSIVCHHWIQVFFSFPDGR